MIIKPVIATMLVFPISKNHKDFIKKEEKLIKEKGQVVSKDILYMK